MMQPGRLVSPFLRLQAIRLWRRPRMLIMATSTVLLPSIPTMMVLPFLGWSGPKGGQDALTAFWVGSAGGFLFSLMLAVMSAGALSLGKGARQEALLLTGLRPFHALMGNFLTFAGLSLLMALALIPAGVVALAGGGLTAPMLLICMTLVFWWPLVGFSLSQLAGSGPKDLGASPVYGGILTVGLLAALTFSDLSGGIAKALPLGLGCGPYAQAATIWGEPVCAPLAPLLPAESGWAAIPLMWRMSLGPLLITMLLFGLSLIRLSRALKENIRTNREVSTAGLFPWSRRDPRAFPIHGNLVFELSKRVKTVISHRTLWVVAALMVAAWGALGYLLRYGTPAIQSVLGKISGQLAMGYLVALIFVAAFMVSLSFAEDAQNNRLNLLRITLVTSEEAVDGKTRALVSKFVLVHLAASVALFPLLGLIHSLAFALVGWAYLRLGVSLGMMSARPDEPLYSALFRSAFSVAMYWVVGLGVEAPLNAVIQALKSGPIYLQGITTGLTLVSRFGLSNSLAAIEPLISGKHPIATPSLMAYVTAAGAVSNAVFHGLLVIVLSRWLAATVRRKYEYYWQTGDWPTGVAMTSVAGETAFGHSVAQQVAVPIGKGADLVDPMRGVPLTNLEVILNPHVRKLVLPPYNQVHQTPPEHLAQPSTAEPQVHTAPPARAEPAEPDPGAPVMQPGKLAEEDGEEEPPPAEPQT